MSLNYNNTNIIVHDFTQKLNYYSKSNIFSGYLSDHNKSLNLRYSNQRKSLYNNNNNINNKNFIEKNNINFRQRQSHSMLKQSPKYFFPSMDNNLLCENLFQRNSQILPSIQKMDKLYQKKLTKKKSDFNAYKYERNKEKKNPKRKTVFLSTTSFDIKKRENLIKSAKNTNQNNPNYFNTGQKNQMKYSLSKDIKLLSTKTPLYKVNYDTSKEKTEFFYFYIIRPENCGYLVKNCFKHRKNWKELENLESKKYNFKWQQNNFGINFNKLSLNPNLKQMVNHFEYKNAVSNKANLFLNMMEFAEMQDINIFKYVPFTILFDYNKVNFFNKIVKFELLYKNITNYIVPMYDINDRKYKKDKERIYSFFFSCGNKIGNKTAINIPETHFVTNKIISEIKLS